MRNAKYWTDLTAGVMIGSVVLYGLFLTSRNNYLLFHSLVEGFSIAVAATIFVVAWNARRIMENNYLLFMGIAYLFVAFLDLLHTLAYKGMGVFPGYGPNTPTQLWILSRYLESLSLFIAPFFFTRKIRINLVLLVYTALVSVAIASIFVWRDFPDCFIQGQGLTLFKKVSEYIISAILGLSIITLYRHRTFFTDNILHLVLISILFTMAAELSFTFYIDVYGLSNVSGHLFKTLSFYLIYKALIETALRKPYTLLFNNLAKREKELADANRALKAINRSREVMRSSDNEFDLLNQICRVIVRDGGYRFAWIGQVADDAEKSVKPVAWAGYEDGYLHFAAITYSDLEQGLGPTGRAIRSLKTMVVKDIKSDPDYNPWREEALKRGYASSIALPIVMEGNVYGALNIYAGQSDAFSEEEVKLLEKLAGDLSYGVTALGSKKQRKLAEEALRNSEDKYRTIFDLSREAIIITRVDGGIQEVNGAAINLFGYDTRDDLKNKNIIDFWVNPQDRNQFIQQLIQNGFVDSIEAQLKHKDGHELTTLGSAALLETQGPEAVIINVLHDISKRKKAEKQIQNSLEEKNVLLKEIHHRIKNNLQIISSLLKLQEYSLDDQKTKTALVDSQNRILAIALVHETLYRSESMAAISLKDYIFELVNLLMQLYSQSTVPIDVNLDLEEIQIGLDQAIPLGLAMNELICNSIKHAFPDRKPGRLEIIAKRAGDRVEIMVSDNGIGLPDDFDWMNTRSFGLRLINTLIEKQLEGTIELNRDQGSKFTIKINI